MKFFSIPIREQDEIELLQKKFGGRFIFSKTTDGRFEAVEQSVEGLREINIRGVRTVKDYSTKLRSWIRQNYEPLKTENDVDRVFK